MHIHSTKEIGARLASAFRLKTRPLAVYGAGEKPAGAVHLADVDRCLAAAMYGMAAGTEVSAIYISADETEGCCPGGLSHTGFIEKPDDIRYFVSTGREDVRGGAAEFLKSSPEIVDACFQAAGKITAPGKYLVVQACEEVPDTTTVRSVCCFGTAEQIRNMAALVHFDRGDPFTPVIVPWGPSCATFITYPAGLAANAPGQTAFMGPQDPTQNRSLPPDTMAIGLPLPLAEKMVKNLDASFVVRRPKVGFPDHGK